jgi:hypothetical protein
MKLTEAGETWIDEAVYKDEADWPSASECKAIRMAIRAFVALVNERADKWRTPGEYQSPAVPVFNAFNEVVRELLGE